MVGLGVTGAGVALDAVTRGLSVLAVDAHDLAFGTSRWSSKLVHGGLRYLAQGQVAVAHESAVERQRADGGHRPAPDPRGADGAPARRSAVSPPSGRGGDGRAARGRRAAAYARTPAARRCPRPRRLSATETLQLAPGLRRAGLRGGLLSWDGQLEDDARLVTTIARTAAGHGAHVRTRARVLHATGTAVTLRDELDGRVHTVAARAVVNAAGVWAGDLVPEVTAAALARLAPGAARRAPSRACAPSSPRRSPGPPAAS